jgi:predicted small secreted protein
MKMQSLTSALLVASVLAATLLLQACNTAAGIGKDVSAAGDAVSGTAEDNKTY